jgi:hypothetical protein
MSQEGSVTEVYGHTSFFAGTLCSTQPDSFTNWVGIGGYRIPQLIQAGFWNSHTGGSYPYYEVLGADHAINATNADIYPRPALGDSFNISVTYESGTAIFAWHDLTNGANVELYDSGEDYQPMSYYYNGAMGEAVDERGTINYIPSTLRNYGSDAWSNVRVAQGSGSLVAIRSTTPHTGIYIYANSIQYSSLTTPSSDPGTFTDVWNSCGVEGG